MAEVFETCNDDKLPLVSAVWIEGAGKRPDIWFEPDKGRHVIQCRAPGRIVLWAPFGDCVGEYAFVPENWADDAAPEGEGDGQTKLSDNAQLVLNYLEQQGQIYLEENRPNLDSADSIFDFLEDEGMSWPEFTAARDELIAAGLAGLVAEGSFLVLGSER
jgi:hypothetical protein